ncbi:hypothetical protein ABW19_dt0205254 [Dactylella cylindrospora]|nr:hypothetical protein ABW19_dt0205254 [Dactylella cylindrospora]
MPGLLGRRLSPIRIIVYIIILTVSITFLSSFTHVPIATESLGKLEDKGKKTFGPYMPSWGGSGAHKTPEPTNSTSSTETWYAHWSWLNPFGSSENFAEGRTVLPPLKARCPIYAYYDQDAKKAGTDNKVMLAWRRAWWAAGFEPIILSLDDAREHGAYPKVVGDKRGEKLEYNILRWLAWERMGTGLLADFRVFPMPTADDHVLPFLRRCDFGESITRFETLGSALFAGSGPSIKSVVSNVTLWKTIPSDITSVADLAPNHFTVDSKPASLAYYSRHAVSEKYKNLAPSDLPGLINAHLHSNFQNRFADGIAVLNPVEPESDLFTLPAQQLAQKLAMCPESPLPTSCPPHLPQCKLCDANTRIQLSRFYQNRTSVFTIGGIPHPLTLEGIVYDQVVHELKFIRRNSTRDVFLRTVTTEIAPHGAGPMFRAVKLKEVIAATGNGCPSSIWSTSEKGFDNADVEWILGFTLPETIPQKPHIRQSTEEQKKQKTIIEDAKHAIVAKTTGLKRLRGAVEGWSLGDFEVWKFVTAFEGRRKSVREEWKKREKGYGKGMD